MRIGYVTTYDPDHPTAFSGAAAAISRGLESAGATVLKIGPLPVPGLAYFRAKQLAYRIFGRKHQYEREPSVARGYARIALQRLRDRGADVVLSDSSIPIAHLDGAIPSAFWTDATFGSLVGYYPEFSQLSAATVRNGNVLEKTALASCNHAIYTSEWAAQGAGSLYGTDLDKIRVVPFGANITEPPVLDAVQENRSALDPRTCELLFIGMDWSRKGGDVAVEAARKMNASGMPTRLHVVGSAPPGPQPAFVTRHGVIRKATAEGRARLLELFRRCHFLILPTRAECVANVYAEACCFGLPIATSDIGGVRTAVVDGYNGVTLPSAATGRDYADTLLSILADVTRFRTMSANARSLYDTSLNWSTASHRVLGILRDATRAASATSHSQAEPMMTSGVV